jgi:acyl-CoA thioester hydrolase
MAQETDSNEHMNVQFYTTKYDMASGQLMAALGQDFQTMKAQNKGFAYVQMNIRYMKEVLEDDPIHIETKVLGVGNKVVTIQHEMIHSITKKVHSDAIAKWVVFDTKIRKAIQLEEEVKKQLESMIDLPTP